MHYGVHSVFISPVGLSKFVISDNPVGVEFRDITPGTKGFFALGVDYDHLDVLVIRPRIQRIFDGDAHVVGHRIQCLWSGKGDAAGLANFADIDVVHDPENPVCIASV